MNIDEFYECKKKLETELATHIARKLILFKDTTGVSVRSVSVNLFYTQTGDEDPGCLLSNVRCKVGI